MDRPHHYILDDAGDPVPCTDLITWAMWFETSSAARRVALTQLDETRISTVFLGLDHNFLGCGPAVLYETLVFLPSGETGSMDRYATREAALEGHALTVKAAELQQEMAQLVTIDALGGIVAQLRAQPQDRGTK